MTNCFQSKTTTLSLNSGFLFQIVLFFYLLFCYLLCYYYVFFVFLWSILSLDRQVLGLQCFSILLFILASSKCFVFLQILPTSPFLPFIPLALSFAPLTCPLPFLVFVLFTCYGILLFEVQVHVLLYCCLLMAE